VIARLGLVVVFALSCLCAFAVPAMASPTECDWEWGGVVEATPEPCTTPVLVLPDGIVPVAQDNASGPVGVQIEGSVAEVATSLNGAVSLSDEGDLANTLTLALGLLIFLQAVGLVFSFRARHRT